MGLQSNDVSTSALAFSIEDALRRQLLDARQRDGVWGYEAGRMPSLEPTCWALIALGTSRPGSSRVLAHWPSDEGALVEQHGGLVNWSFHALALFTRLALGAASVSELRSIATALVDARGIALKPSSGQRQDSDLHGWSWTDGTFSWLEPTAWALVALKKCRARGIVIEGADKRIRDGEAILQERACVTGGWNYGSSSLSGKDLPAYVPTTALGLLALQDRGDEVCVRRSLNYLEEHAGKHRSTRGLALSVLALRRHGRSTVRLKQELRRWLDQHPSPDVASIGMALSALERSVPDTFALCPGGPAAPSSSDVVR
jgi:hypothetical protein